MPAEQHGYRVNFSAYAAVRSVPNFESLIDAAAAAAAAAGSSPRSAGSLTRALEINSRRRARHPKNAQLLAPCVGVGRCRNSVEIAKCQKFVDSGKAVLYQKVQILRVTDRKAFYHNGLYKGGQLDT